MGNWIAAAVVAVISGVVIYILGVVNLQSQDRSISATQVRSMRTSQMNLVQMVEFDFQNIGSNFPDFINEPDVAITGLDTTGSPKFFQFVGQTERWADPDTVRYEWSKTGKVKVKREGKAEEVDAHTVTRYVNGAVAGSSAGVITRFQITLLHSDGTPAISFADARQIQVSVSMVSNLGADNMISESEWNSIIRPAALARLDYLDYIET
jgi:hypothetical protein